MTKKKAPKNPLAAAGMVLDPEAPWPMRKTMLQRILENPEGDGVVRAVVDAAAQANGDDPAAVKARELDKLLRQMMEGPLRMATFVRTLSNGFGRRAEVLLPDGATAYCTVPDEEVAKDMRRGDRVWLEAQGRAVLFADPGTSADAVGEEGRLERRLGDEHVEVSVRDQGRYVFRASADLEERLASGDVEPGATLVVCPQRLMAFRDVPEEDGLAHFRFLVREAPPEVDVARDIGAPPRFIEDFLEHARTEMVAPELGRRYRLRRSRMVLLTGLPGTGKTLSIQGLWNALYDTMADVTGVAKDALPPRVLRFRLSEILSKWLGESDKRIDRYFDELEELAGRPFVAEDGTEHTLPVLSIFEEVDGLARRRGDGDAIHDRIQTTLLQRLDATAQRLKDRLILFVFTTNTPHVVDPAFLRRAGGVVEHFGPLDRPAFLEVFERHLAGRPFRADDGDEARARARVARDVSAWLYSRNGEDEGQVEVAFVGRTERKPFFRRDFLNGGLVDRAVQKAASDACRAERAGAERPGLDRARLVEAFDAQVRFVVDRLQPGNVGDYLPLPDGARVASVHRPPRGGGVLPIRMERS